MKVLHISTHDIIGGAAIAAYRLHQGLRHIGINSAMLVNHRYSNDRFVHNIHKNVGRIKSLQIQLASYMDKQPLYRRHIFPSTNWSLNWFPSPILSAIKRLQPNIVHLHWVGDGFLPIRILKHISTPIIWTFHDMWAMTGGCHYTAGCERFMSGCGLCPQLGSKRERDSTSRIFDLKKAQWHTIPFTIITPSHWLADCTRKSPLFHHKIIEVIPNGVDIHTYYPRNKETLRPFLGLPVNKRLILFGAQTGTGEKRKGFHHLLSALQHLRHIENLELVILGTEDNSNNSYPLPTHFMGALRDQLSLSLIYAAVDVFVAPSEQDNLPNTLLEAMACGIPVVAFDIGGMADVITHQETGYLATPFSTEDLADGILWVLNHPQYEHLAAQNRARIVARHDIIDIAKRYAQRYQTLVAQ